MDIILYSVVGIVLVVASPVLYLMVRAKYEISKMTPLETQEIGPGLYTFLDGHANVYLLRHDSGYLAIDAGEKNKISVKELQKLRIDPESVTDVFLTHSDFDHAGAVEVFSKAKVFLAAEEEQLISGTTARTFGKMGILRLKNKVRVPYTLLNDGDLMQIGSRRIQCVLAPGHTPGSMSFLVDGKDLFTGDTLRFIGGQITSFVPFFTMDLESNKKSIAKLATVNGVERIFTAHHGFTDDAEKLLKDYTAQKK